MISPKDLTEFDPDKKDFEWINQQVTYYRQSWIRLIDYQAAQANMEVLFGAQNMDDVRSMFADPAKAGIKFIPMAMLEKLRQIFTAEIQEGGIHVHVCATDPTAFNEKERDKDLLSNRKVIETVISKEQRSIGGPEYRMAEDQDEEGNPLFAGNVQDFDEMGFDEDSSEDIGYFFQFYHRLNHEIMTETVINSYFALNELPQTLEFMVDDALAKKAVAIRCFVNDDTGAIDIKYIAPEKVWWMPGLRKDGKDALAKGYEELVTVGDFLDMVGADFDEEKDMPYLLQAVNNNAAITMPGLRYTGVMDEKGCCVHGDSTGLMIGFDDMLNVKVSVGYIEFKTCNGTAYRSTKSNYHGNPSIRPMKSLDKKVWENSVYKKEVYYNQMTYRAYYLATSTLDQRLFKAGPANWQVTEGADDEYSAFSIATFVQTGKTFVEICTPFITIWQKAFAKLEFEINRAKPAGRAYFYDSLVSIADQMFPKETNRYNAIMQVLKFFTESPNEIYTIPQIDGQAVGGGGHSSFELKNGLSATVNEFRAIMDWAEGMIDKMIGISPARKVYAPQPREVQGLQEGSTAFSERATQYMPRMISNVLVNAGNRTLWYAQDIVRFGGQTIAFKHLTRMLGDETVKTLKQLGKVSLHRYGIFVEWYNLMRDREELRLMTMRAMENKEISPEQAVLINAIRSPKQAAMMLAREKKRTELKNAKQQQMQNDFQLQLQAQMQEGRMKQIALAGEYDIKAKDTAGRWLYESRKVEGVAKMQSTEMRVDAETQQIRQQNMADINQMEAELMMKEQAAAPMGEQ